MANRKDRRANGIRGGVGAVPLATALQIASKLQGFNHKRNRNAVNILNSVTALALHCENIEKLLNCPTCQSVLFTMINARRELNNLGIEEQDYKDFMLKLLDDPGKFGVSKEKHGGKDATPTPQW